MSEESTSTIASRYKLLLRMPSPKTVLIFIALLSIILSLLTFQIIGDFARSISVFVLLILASIGLNLLFKETLLKHEIVLTLNRLNILSFVQITLFTILSFIGFILSLQMKNPFYFVIGMCIGISIATFIGFSTIFVLSFKKISCILPVLSSFTISIALAELLSIAQPDSMRLFIISSTIGVTMGALTILILEKFATVLNQSPLSFFRAFVASLLVGENEFLESMFRRVGDEVDILVDIIQIRDVVTKSHIVSLIVPRFHPGPFRSIGGSITPYIIEKKFMEKDMEAIVLKGISGHEMNIASYKDGERIADEILRVALDMVKEDRFYGMTLSPNIVKHGGAFANIFGIGSTKVAILSLHPNPMEDIPSNIVDNGLEDTVIIDAHNCFQDNAWRSSSEILSELYDLLTNIKSIKLEEDSKKMEIGIARMLPLEYGLRDGLGPGGISCIVIRVDGKETCYVVVDSNNALPEVRSHIQKVLQEEGVSNFELMTTDTHLVCALKLGGRGYHPLGEVIKPEKLAEYVKNLYRQAKERIRPAEGLHRRILVKGIKVFSENGLHNMAKSITRAARLYLSMLAATPALSLIAIVLI